MSIIQRIKDFFDPSYTSKVGLTPTPIWMAAYNPNKEDLTQTSLSMPSYAKACPTCGGFFDPIDMKSVYQLIIYKQNEDNIILSDYEESRYCKRCVPQCSFLLILRDRSGTTLDEKGLRITDWTMQEVEPDSGVDLYIIDEEEYSRLYCKDCGEFISENTYCQTCLPATANEKKKAGSKRASK